MYPGRVAGSVERIHIAVAESELPHPVDAVEVTAEGVVGDRYDKARNLTLIEAEALEGFLEDTGIELSAAESRRQVLTRGIRLNDLVGAALHGRGRRVRRGRSCASPATTSRRLTHPGVLRGHGAPRRACAPTSSRAAGSPSATRSLTCARR